MMWKAEDKAQSWGEGSYLRQLLRSVLLWGSRWTPAYCSVFSYIAATLICLLRARGEQGCDAVIASSTACVLMVQSDTNHNKRISNRATSISVCPTWLTCSPISLSLSPPSLWTSSTRSGGWIAIFIDSLTSEKKTLPSVPGGQFLMTSCVIAEAGRSGGVLNERAAGAPNCRVGEQPSSLPKLEKSFTQWEHFQFKSQIFFDFLLTCTHWTVFLPCFKVRFSTRDGGLWWRLVLA